MNKYKKNKKFTNNKKTSSKTDDFINSDEEVIEEIKEDKIENKIKSLVIVESPGKIKKIRSFLGNNYIVMASVGHIMDLPPKELGIDLETLEPTYVINTDKKNVVSGLKKIINSVDEIYIATDGDREVEFIGHSLVKLLKLKEYKRIIFHEITKSAINKALQKPTLLDEHLIKAQQCRRITDRLIGFLISPELSKNVKGGYGAGRVQSVIVKMILDKQEQREEFWNNNNSTYFTCNGSFLIDDSKLDCKMYIDHIYLKTTKEIMLNIFKLIKTFNNKPNEWIITDTKYRDTKIYPSPPFITSTLQQEAFYKFKYNPDKTMRLAQQLYEKGHITYMRTDSPVLSNEALFNIKNFIIKKYGENFHKFKQYKSKNSSAQEAHECIRPTHIENNILDDVDDDASNLYNLIWCRTVASQMVECIMENLDITIKLRVKEKLYKKLVLMPNFIGTLSNVKQLGFKILYEKQKEYQKINILNKKVKFIDMISKETLNMSSPLYNQPLLIKSLEKHGIGRPSTYANLLKKIMDYKYVEIKNVDGINKELCEIKYSNKINKIEIKTKTSLIGGEKQKLVATELGKNVVKFLNKNYLKIMDYKFTSDIENKLDLIANNKIDYKNVLKQFYNIIIKKNI